MINISSVGGISGTSGIGTYNITKAALIHLTKVLAVELAPQVRVNAIAPGLVKTDFARALWEPQGDDAGHGLPLQRLGEPDDIAGSAVFLASDAARWITGHVLVVDGGALIARSPVDRSTSPSAGLGCGRGRTPRRRSARLPSRSSSTVQRPSLWMRVDEGERLEQATSPPGHEEHPALDRAVLGREVGDERRHVAGVRRVELALLRLRPVLDAGDRLDEPGHRRRSDRVRRARRSGRAPSGR